MSRFLAVMCIAGAIATVGWAAEEAAAPEKPKAPPSAVPGIQPSSEESVKEWVRLIPKGTFARQPATPSPGLPAQVQRAFVIPIRGVISGTLADVLEEKVTRCKASGAQLVIFDVDSPGGSMGAMQEIVKLITEELRETYTVAYVNREAISAASIISLACNEIVLTPDAKFGDAMPVLLGPQGYIPIPPMERGKIESYARSDIRGLAHRNGYSVPLCEAMITQDREIWLIKNTETDQLKVVDSRDYQRQVSGAPQSGEKATAAPANAAWKFLALIDGPQELLTMTSPEAVALGFADYVFPTLRQVEEHYHVTGQAKELKDDWVQKIATFLTSPIVTAILFMGGLLCVYAEFHSPGFGVFGILAIVCFALLFGSRFLIGLAQWWEIALFVLGLILIAVEVFAIPGFGVLGILGIAFCVVGLVGIVIPNAPGKLPIPDTSLDWSVFQNGLMALSVGFLLAMAGAAALTRYLPQMPIARRLILVPGSAAPEPSLPEDSPFLDVKAGDVGTVEAVCRPVGKVRFGDNLLDASSEGNMIEAGAKVRVLRRQGNQLVVERIENT